MKPDSFVYLPVLCPGQSLASSLALHPLEPVASLPLVGQPTMFPDSAKRPLGAKNGTGQYLVGHWRAFQI